MRRTLAPTARRGARALSSWLKNSASVFLMLLVWEAISRARVVSPLILPSPEQVLIALAGFAKSGDLAYHGAATLYRALAGFALAAVVGVLLGCLMGRARWVERLIGPIFFFGNPIPKITFYPVFIFLFGLSDLSKISVIFLECLYPVAIQTLSGMRDADPVLIWAAQNFGASRAQQFWNVLLPSAAPAIFAGLRIALPVSLILTIITEIIGESRGLGYVVSESSASFEPARALAAIVVIAIAGFLLDRAMAAIRNKVVFWSSASIPLG